MLLIENHDAVIQGNLTAGITEWLDFHTAFASPDNIIHLGATLKLSHFSVGYSYAQNKHYRNAHFIHLYTTY